MRDHFHCADIHFEGGDAAAAVAFIAAVEVYIKSQGKANDDEWIADYVAACFSGEALRWYESSLTTQVRGSWKLLRIAFMEK